MKIFEEFAVLFTGVFGLQNGIFGKFYWFFSFANVWKLRIYVRRTSSTGYSLELVYEKLFHNNQTVYLFTFSAAMVKSFTI